MPFCSPSLASGYSSHSPSLAEGVRGWVNPLKLIFHTCGRNLADFKKAL
ncbi:hypothetical protein [Helicobacter sp. T3_23-1059]